MKPVKVLFLATAALAVVGCGSSNDSGPAPKCDAETTFAQVQAQIFEGRGCTASSCHGDSPQSGLDLRADVAYENLINVPSVAGDQVRVFPAEQDLSLLYLKVAAKTDGSSLADQGISGGTMPVGDNALSDDDLGLLRAWIRGGAPQDGIVEGSDEFANCSLEGDIAPNKIQPLPVPDTDKGVQFYSGGWTVPSEGEGEVCFISHYDYSASIPDELKVPCTDIQGGPDRDCFAYNQILLAQDPQSHHSIVEFYVPPEGKEAQWDPTNGAWKNWTCLGGDKAGVSCTPGSTECGDRSQCVTTPATSVACIGYKNGPNDLGTVGGLFGTANVRQNLATAQEATFRERYPTDVYSLVPVSGYIVWDSHAFNPTKTDTTVEQWMNIEFATPEEQVYSRTQIFAAREIFGMGLIDPFTSKEVCATYTIPENARLMTLSTHTHRFGKEFRVWYPPNDICERGAEGCQPETRDPDYVSRDYADPLYQRFFEPELPVYDSPDARGRTFKYCSLFDNGETNPEEVRRESTKPDAETCDVVDSVRGLATQGGLLVLGCGCEPEDRFCLGGPSQGMACNGDDSACGSGGICDACAAGGGVTTEEEMFILLGSYFVTQ